MQVEIRSLLETMQWKEGEGFLIPAYLTKLSVTDVSAAVFITHEEVFGKKYTREEFKHDLSQLTIEDCIIIISKMLTLMENEGRLNATVQKSLIQEFFTGALKEKLLRLLNTQPHRVVFFESQLLLVAKYAIMYAKDEPSNDFLGKQLFPLFLKVVLGVTDLLDSGKHDTIEMQKLAIRGMYFDAKADFFYALRRTEDLFVRIPDELMTHPQYLDIPALFLEATGFELEDYLFFGPALIAPFFQQKLGQAHEGNWFINLRQFFINTKVTQKEIDRITEEFTTTIETLKTLFRSQESFEYNFNGLVQHPLVTNADQNVFFPLDLGFLKDKVTLQVYWIIFDHIKKTYGDKKLSGALAEKFSSFFQKRTTAQVVIEVADQKTRDMQETPLSRYTNFMGACFEEYVYKLLKRIYPSSPLLDDRLVREIVYIPKKSEVRTVDNILINSTSLILIETKISQLNVYATGIVGDLEAFREDVRKIIVKAFKTIQRTKEDFQRGLLDKALPVNPGNISVFYPVIVTYGKFIMFPIVWTIVEEEIKKKIPDYDPELLNNLQIVQADEIELIEAFLTNSGISFEQLLSRKIGDTVFKTLPFHNFINHEFSGRTRLISKYQEQQYTHFMERLKTRILDVKAEDEKRI